MSDPARRRQRRAAPPRRRAATGAAPAARRTPRRPRALAAERDRQQPDVDGDPRGQRRLEGRPRRGDRAQQPRYRATQPSAPPAARAAACSAKSCRASRARVAPRARRTLSSCSRATPRASSMQATFTQASSSTRSAGPIAMRVGVNGGAGAVSRSIGIACKRHAACGPSSRRVPPSRPSSSMPARRRAKHRDDHRRVA